MKTRTDHLVVAAKTLEQGVQYIKQTLGTDILFGGKHPKMGTHNCLMKLGEDIFLEVISIDPDGEPPKRPRWFSLDDALLRKNLEKTPVLLTWVVNTPDIKALTENSAYSAGIPEEITRGELRWDFALPEDGRLFAGGLLPFIISWHTKTHPAGNMTDTGCRLVKLEIHHTCTEWLRRMLDSVGAGKLAEIHTLPAGSTPFMTAYISTPSGLKTIRSI